MVDYRKGVEVQKRAETQSTVETTDHEGPRISTNKRRRTHEYQTPARSIKSEYSDDSSSGTNSDSSQENGTSLKTIIDHENNLVSDDSFIIPEIPPSPIPSHSLGLVTTGNNLSHATTVANNSFIHDTRNLQTVYDQYNRQFHAQEPPPRPKLHTSPIACPPYIGHPVVTSAFDFVNPSRFTYDIQHEPGLQYSHFANQQ
ncbi:unnamed protein product [Orchesella dallaii]|uniref:Uncharacterized protein n=1 Tax=Orchesella dallaii TaxID=48710 RepID=A0ABP1S7C7_9HEXA